MNNKLKSYMRLSDYLNNPIIKIFRECGLSEVATQERINKEWSVPPEGFPMGRISDTVNGYLRRLVWDIRKRTSDRRKSNIPVTKTYVVKSLGLLPAEYEMIKHRL